VTIPRPGETDTVEDGVESEAAEREVLCRDPAAALASLIEPIESHWRLVEAGAALILGSRTKVDDSDSTALRARWTVRLKIKDVRAFRQVALDSSPDADPAEVGNSIAAAWHLAAEPYAPLRGVPGISWTCVDVGVEHMPAASAMATGAA
jgi:hypothetical protein